MGRLFGTDGIRGVANEKLTVELAVATGRAVAASIGMAKGKSNAKKTSITAKSLSMGPHTEALRLRLRLLRFARLKRRLDIYV